MALTVVEEPPVDKEVFEPPPTVALTPCDPWPRPYFLEDGLRRWCKQRWRGREILDIFRDEFRDRTPEYYAKSIEEGAIQLNGKPLSSTKTTVKNGDIISHTLHRHEPPVTGQPIGIVHEDEDMIVISKPAGVPVHPAGRYNYNSVVEIMRAERGHQWNPLPCNRLDRLTSGIMFIAKHKKSAEKLTEQLTQRTVRKQYVARVKGEFPEEDVVCEQPILQISPKLGLNRVRANGKEARTVFKRLAYYPAPAAADGTAREGYSIVRCLPLTGRTHQLRVHLQFLGHPITNDPIYSNQRVFGPNLGKDSNSADDDESVMDRLGRMGKDEVAEAIAYHDEMVADYEKKKAEKMTGQKCEVCGTDLYSDPGAHELGIYLHAMKYASMEGDWSYETPLPEWALPTKGYKGPVQPTEDTDPAAKLEMLGLEDNAEEVPQAAAAS
ncbi:DRAP deaminase [Saxophila tyrrhenica]|uniref:Pseudouridine synthase n=1 Tax=Saxophila tyrrhenica TaxID=1690608 RepID=A0AAV9P549_9PEZI|nr:DRAP deaminase [Saxophila tyrrhenica]